jgi:hypothetical protein
MPGGAGQQAEQEIVKTFGRTTDKDQIRLSRCRDGPSAAVQQSVSESWTGDSLRAFQQSAQMVTVRDVPAEGEGDIGGRRAGDVRGAARPPDRSRRYRICLLAAHRSKAVRGEQCHAAPLLYPLLLLDCLTTKRGEGQDIPATVFAWSGDSLRIR